MSLARLAEPLTALEGLTGLVVIDEVQRRPDLFPVLRVLVDRRSQAARFLVLGSAGGELLRQSSESLAGRTRTIEVCGFDLGEVGAEAASGLWLRGGLPRSFLAGSDRASLDRRRAFVRTLLERDLPQWGVRVAAVALQRFWSTLAHRHAQLWNATDLARALGVDPTTTRRYLDLLTDALVLRQLQPWHASRRKSSSASPRMAGTSPVPSVGGVPPDVHLSRISAAWQNPILPQPCKPLSKTLS